MILSYQVDPFLFYVEYDANVQSEWKGLNGMERRNAKLEDAAKCLTLQHFHRYL